MRLASSVWLRRLLIAALSSSAVIPAYAAAPAASAPASAESSDALEQRRQEAKKQYEQGVAAYRAERFAEAIELFLAADRTLPSAALSFNVARAYEQLRDVGQALRFYRDYLRRESGPPNADTKAARERVAALEAELMARGQQQVTLFSTPEGASLTIDGRALGTTPWTGELTPGPHQIRLEKPGFEVSVLQFELPAAHAFELRVPLVLRTATPAEPGPRTAAASGATAAPATSAAPGFGPWPWITLAAGGVTLAVAGGIELSRRSLESEAKDPALPQIAYQEKFESVQARENAARALAVVGGALVVVGGVLLFVDPARKGGARRSAALACVPEACFGSFALEY